MMSTQKQQIFYTDIVKFGPIGVALISYSGVQPAVIGAIDYIYNFIQIDKQLKMTKEELRKSSKSVNLTLN